MSFPVHSPARPDDDLDGLLRAFFQAEMPRPWPALKAPPPSRPSVPPVPVRRGLFRSRLALAASLALLVTGALALPGKFTRPEQTAPEGIKINYRDHLPGSSGKRYELPPNIRISSEKLEQTTDGTTIKLIVEETPPAR